MNIILSFLTIVIIARALGPNGQGEYSLLVQSARIFFYFFSFGFPLAMVFYYQRAGEKIHDLLKTFFGFYIVLMMIAYLSFSLFITISYEHFFQGLDQKELFIGSLAIAGWFLNSYIGAVYVSIENFKRKNTTQIVQPVTLSAMALILFFLGELSVVNAIAAYVASFALSILFGVYCLFVDGLLIKIVKGRIDVTFFKKTYVYAFKNYVGQTAEFLIYKCDIYLISFFLTKSSLGIYIIAVNIVERLWVISESVSMVLFAKLANTKDEQRRDYLSSFTLRVNFLMSLIGGLIVLLTIQLFVKLFFGTEYLQSAIYTMILLPGVILQSVSMMMKKILEARGYPGANAIASTICLVLNIVLNIILIPRYEVAGAAVATSITYVIYFFIQASSLKRKFGLTKRSYMLIKVKDLFVIRDLILKGKNKGMNL